MGKSSNTIGPAQFGIDTSLTLAEWVVENEIVFDDDYQIALYLWEILKATDQRPARSSRRTP